MKIDTSSADTIATVAAGVLKTHPFLIVATVDTTGQPWAVPVHQITLPTGELTWRSAVSARHSQNIAADSRVSGVLFSTSAEYGEVSLFLEGTAASLEQPDDIATALDNRYANNPDKRPPRADLSAGAGYRIYAFIISAAWVNDDSHVKTKVDVSKLVAHLSDVATG